VRLGELGDGIRGRTPEIQFPIVCLDIETEFLTSPKYRNTSVPEIPTIPIIQRAGRLARPQGELALTMSANQAVQNDLLHYLDVLKKPHRSKSSKTTKICATLGSMSLN
jgi:hypothetical protein